ncbi:MAG: rhomboid family intramembrane serine protease [Herbiconiux sp.]|nr:rhomboid family intramembrane serine protease [Herbiconiux sp.]
MPVCYRHPERESHIRCQRCDRPICPDCMRDAAVGFQCPSCIAEGKKATRSGRTPYGGLRPTDASITSGVFIAINVAVWLAISITGGRGSSRVYDYLVLRPSGICDIGGGGYDVVPAVCTSQNGTYLPGVADGAYWQLVTTMFTHESLLHLAVNMFVLWSLGPQLEAAVGRVRFLVLYVLSGLAGSALVYWAAGEYQDTLGASGAIFGLLGALLVLAYKVGGDVRSILTWIGLNFVITFVIPGISWQGHLGGFLGGLAIGAALVYAPRGPRRTLVQVAGIAVVAVVVALALVARTLQLT